MHLPRWAQTEDLEFSFGPLIRDPFLPILIPHLSTYQVSIVVPPAHCHPQGATTTTRFRCTHYPLKSNPIRLDSSISKGVFVCCAWVSPGVCGPMDVCFFMYVCMYVFTHVYFFSCFRGFFLEGTFLRLSVCPDENYHLPTYLPRSTRGGGGGSCRYITLEYTALN